MQRLFLFFIALSLILVLAHAVGLRWNRTESVPTGLYRLTGGEPELGALIALCLAQDIARLGLERGYLKPGTCPSGAMPLLKPVVAMSGHVIELTHDELVVRNLTRIPIRTQENDSLGRPLNAIPRGVYTVSEDEIWVVSQTHPSSWDSRYFGAVSRASILGVANPLLTFGNTSNRTPDNKVDIQ